MKNKPQKHQPTRIEMQRALAHIEKLIALAPPMIRKNKFTTAINTIYAAKRFAVELAERMEMPA